jgi:hypothetical protein
MVSQPPSLPPDPSMLLAQPAYKENIGYVLAAIEAGAFVGCPKCNCVLGVGASDGTAEFPCPEHG